MTTLGDEEIHVHVHVHTYTYEKIHVQTHTCIHTRGYSHKLPNMVIQPPLLLAQHSIAGQLDTESSSAQVCVYVYTKHARRFVLVHVCINVILTRKRM